VTQELTVIDIGIGNLSSVLRALKKAGAQAVPTRDPARIAQARKLILPGVGAFGAGATALQEFGLVQPIREAVLERQTPILGFCMGMQLLADVGYENGHHSGLGLLRAEVKPLDVTRCKVLPHIGWNNLDETAGIALLDGLPPRPDFYFVHSFHLTGMDAETQVSRCTYGQEQVTAVVQRGHICGTQFHPEKSLANGIRILKNFIDHA
jgi:glutamine amidotransferase